MPLYEFHHSNPLSTSQQDALAAAVTKIHTEKFTTPSLFVNVRFHHFDESGSAGGGGYYVGGKRRQTNTLTAHVRTGPSRTQAAYDSLTAELQKTWDAIIKPHYHSQKLTRIFVIGAILAARESGLAIPAAGQEEQWYRDSWGEFEAKAQKGDEDFVGLMEEVERRGLVKG